MALAHPEDIDGGFLQVACALGRGDDYAKGAVGNEAAIEQVERLRDPSRVMVILEGQRFVVELGHRIHVGPLPLGDRYRAHMIVGGAIQMHVAASDESILGVDAEKPIGGVESTCETVGRR
jgi:hypothetical protein